jgi:hypothetical protein
LIGAACGLPEVGPPGTIIIGMIISPVIIMGTVISAVVIMASVVPSMVIAVIIGLLDARRVRLGGALIA